MSVPIPTPVLETFEFEEIMPAFPPRLIRQDAQDDTQDDAQ
jgi:hypothetical protein